MIPPLNPCSCEGVAWATVDGARWFVHCENCGNSVSAWSGRAVVVLWNLRHAPKPVKIQSKSGDEWQDAGLWAITYTDKAVIFRVVVWPENGHFLYGVRKFRMRRKRWIPGLTFIPRWSGVPCRIAP